MSGGTTSDAIGVATRLAAFAAGLVLAVVVGWAAGTVLGPVLTLTPPGAPALPHTTTHTDASQENP